MAHQVPWNKQILEEFITLAILTEEEEQVMRTRVAGWPISKQAYELKMSPEKVSRIIRRLKQKYDRVQPQSEILPKRKSSAKETWMDKN